MNADKIVAEAQEITAYLRNPRSQMSPVIYNSAADTIDALLKLLDEGRQEVARWCARIAEIEKSGIEEDWEDSDDDDEGASEELYTTAIDACNSIAARIRREFKLPPYNVPAPQPARAGDGGKEMG